MLHFENLAKRYGDHVVFSGLTHRFGPGCVSLQAPNGSGKSTLIDMLAGATPADSGVISIDGHTCGTPQAAQKLAYVPDDCMTHPSLSGRALFERVASVMGTRVESPTYDLAERFGLTSRLDMRFDQMSLGTRKKMYLAAISIGNPTVILADEPSNGLDAAARRVLVELFRELGHTRVVLFSTHDPDFADACDARVVDFSALQALA
ncbi:ABC transporter ATP-binding protein [Paraburkholderia sp.]|uniref:ATP-binding cassette domain-containing protein n=1 Tax=Paraburkholderia sp. TaxID=1926495 RepID=UPI0023A60CFC|nr:ABC transporter ATP-binding protein [Paraburkholderia sp.]MDE1179869.1 ABC transporter ATP-binding protein [Paraburkholderia sp.]